MVLSLSRRPHLYSRPARRRGSPGRHLSRPPPGHRHRPVREGRVGARPSVGLPGRYCVLSDFHAAPDTRLDLAYLERRLRHYPDQSLAANILEGVRLDADVELGPYRYLTSPRSPSGYASVGKELRRPRSIWWYEFYSSLPSPAHVPQRPGGDGAQVGAGQAPSAPPLDWVVRELDPSLPSSARVPQRPGGDSAQVGAGQTPAPHRGQQTARPHLRRLRPPGHLLVSPASRPMASRTMPMTTSTSLSWRPRSYTRHGRRRRRG